GDHTRKEGWNSDGTPAMDRNRRTPVEGGIRTNGSHAPGYSGTLQGLRIQCRRNLEGGTSGATRSSASSRPGNGTLAHSWSHYRLQRQVRENVRPERRLAIEGKDGGRRDDTRRSPHERLFPVSRQE